TAQNLEVSAAQVKTFDVPLEIGPVQETVEVRVPATSLQAEAPVRGGNLLASDILNLPYASRDPALLSLTLPGVVSTKFVVTETPRFALNGARGPYNNITIDGTDNNDISVGGPALEVRNPGSVEEVSVQTTNFDSE